VPDPDSSPLNPCAIVIGRGRSIFAGNNFSRSLRFRSDPGKANIFCPGRFGNGLAVVPYETTVNNVVEIASGCSRL